MDVLAAVMAQNDNTAAHYTLRIQFWHYAVQNPVMTLHCQEYCYDTILCSGQCCAMRLQSLGFAHPKP